MIRAEYPALSAADVVKVLESTASDKGDPGRDDTYGHGELNILAALKAAAAVQPSATPSSDPSKPGVIAGSGGGTDNTRLAVVGFGVLVLAGAVIALVVGVRRR